MSLVIWLGISTMMNSDTPPCESRYRPLGQLFLHCSLEPQICLCLFPLRLGVCQGYVSMIKDFLTHDFLDHLWQKRAWKGRKKVRCLACIFMFFSVFRSLGQFLCCKYWRYQNIISSSTYSPPFILWSSYFPLLYLGDVIHKNHISPRNVSSPNSPRCWCIQKIVYQLPHNKDPKCHLHHSHDIQASTRLTVETKKDPGSIFGSPGSNLLDWLDNLPFIAKKVQCLELLETIMGPDGANRETIISTYEMKPWQVPNFVVKGEKTLKKQFHIFVLGVIDARKTVNWCELNWNVLLG